MKRLLHFNTVNNTNGEIFEYTVDESKLNEPLDTVLSNIENKVGVVEFTTALQKSTFSTFVRCEYITAWQVEVINEQSN